MKRDEIDRIDIDDEGRLHVVPSNSAFPLIYLEAMEVQWDEKRKSLHSPKPREWTYSRWFKQILCAADRQGYKLSIVENTKWHNVDDQTQSEMVASSAVDHGE